LKIGIQKKSPEIFLKYYAHKLWFKKTIKKYGKNDDLFFDTSFEMFTFMKRV